MGNPFLVLKETAKLFSRVAVSFYVSTNAMSGLIFLHPQHLLVVLLLFILAILIGDISL